MDNLLDEVRAALARGVAFTDARTIDLNSVQVKRVLLGQLLARCEAAEKLLSEYVDCLPGCNKLGHVDGCPAVDFVARYEGVRKERDDLLKQWNAAANANTALQEDLALLSEAARAALHKTDICSTQEWWIKLNAALEEGERKEPADERAD